jgi:nickel superoxide dismutase
MLYKILNKLNRKNAFPVVAAHCDIPCGIYDPSSAQINALTVIRCLDLISELEGQTLTLSQQAKLSRLVAQKEEHAEKVKHDVRVIWGDYFKQPQFDQVEGVHDLAHKIMISGSKCRQEIDLSHGEELLKLVNEFAQAFWLTKGVETFTAVSPYAPARNVVYPKLN